MLRFRVIGAIAAAAFAVVSVAPGAMAQAAKPAAAKTAAKPAVAKMAATPKKGATVSGKVTKIDAPLQHVTLNNGLTFKVKDAAVFKKLKVGSTVKFKVA